jgi:hypothetical protein
LALPFEDILPAFMDEWARKVTLDILAAVLLEFVSDRMEGIIKEKMINCKKKSG